MAYSKLFVCALGLSALADAQISLGSAAVYGVFAASTITNTGLTVINARIGLSPGTSITGFPPGVDAGEDISNAAAVQAAADIKTAYNNLAALAPTADLTGQDLGGQTLNAGVYSFSSSGGLTGTLTLDGQGSPDAVFVFQFGSTLTTASASQVVLINGAQACNVYWQVGSSATLGTGTMFAGNVLAQASITVTTGTSLSGGGFYALTAAVTLDTNSIDPSGACGASVQQPLSASSTSSTSSTQIATTTPPATTTITTTSTITNPASTTTITVTASATTTVTQTVATSYSTCTSTSTQWSTKSATKTASATACPSTTSKKAMAKRARSTSTKTKTFTTTCAGHTSTYTQKPSAVRTSTAKATWTSTSTIWHTKTSTTTRTATKTPSCTAHAKRDHQRMFQ